MMTLKKVLSMLIFVCTVLSGCSKSSTDNTATETVSLNQPDASYDTTSATISGYEQPWQESIVFGSETLDGFSAIIDDVPYYGGYIGTFSDSEGYIVLTAGPASGMQPIRICLTSDSGASWEEIGNPFDQHEHTVVLTGAAFSSSKTGFLSYRYTMDAGPDIWWTSDGGKTWTQLTVTLPDEYRNTDGSTKPEYRFTPKSPIFNNGNGIFPITVLNVDTETETTVYMYSSDNGMTWHF